MDSPDYTLSIVVPCHNAKNIIKPLVARMHACPVPRVEIIVVDDASTDGTRQMLEDELAGLVHRVVYLMRQSGKAAAVAAGAAAATGQYTVVQSAVLEFDPADYPLLIQPLLADEADAVFARGTKNAKKADLTSRLVSSAVGLSLPDISGSAKAFCTPVLRELALEADPGGFSAQVAAKLAKGEYRVAHVALPRRRGKNQQKDSALDSVRSALRASKYIRGGKQPAAKE